jgi:hypothetical protein
VRRRRYALPVRPANVAGAPTTITLGAFHTAAPRQPGGPPCRPWTTLRARSNTRIQQTQRPTQLQIACVGVFRPLQFPLNFIVGRSMAAQCPRPRTPARPVHAHSRAFLCQAHSCVKKRTWPSSAGSRWDQPRERRSRARKYRVPRHRCKGSTRGAAQQCDQHRGRLPRPHEATLAIPGGIACYTGVCLSGFPQHSRVWSQRESATGAAGAFLANGFSRRPTRVRPHPAGLSEAAAFSQLWIRNL